MSGSDWVAASATSLADDIRSGRRSSVEVVTAVLERIDAVNDRLNAVVQRADDVLTAANRADEQLARGALTTNDGEIAVNWALDGHGILMRAEWDIARFLASGRLVQVLPDWETPDADIYAVYPQRVQGTARVRQFVEHLAQAFGALTRSP